MKNFQIAIDGPAGSGKSTISKLVCDRLGFIHLDTGAMYRAVTLEALNLNVNLEDESSYDFLNGISIIQDGEKIFLNGNDVSEEIRTPRVAGSVSIVAKMPVVRYKMVDLQRAAASKGLFLLDGRDIGTAVLPNADVKIYLTASVEERARRRYAENKLKGTNESMDDIMENIKTRDYIDSHRELNPLKQADDAILVDTTNMGIEEVVETIVKIIKERFI